MIHKPNWVAIFEPKIDVDMLPRNYLQTKICVLCRPCLLSSSLIVSSTTQFIIVRTGNFTQAFIHAKNNYVQRRALWYDLLQLPDLNIYCIGDFNVVMGAHELSSGSHRLPLEEFQDFMVIGNFFDIKAMGNFTWASRHSSCYTAARLDRALANQGFLDLWRGVELLVLLMVCSDHHPLHLSVSTRDPFVPRPFRFQAMRVQHEAFIPLDRKSVV